MRVFFITVLFLVAFSSPLSAEQVYFGKVFQPIQGGKYRSGIGLIIKGLHESENGSLTLLVKLVNRTKIPYRIAELEVMKRVEGGFLRRQTVEEFAILSELECDNENLVIPQQSNMLCGVSFTLPQKRSDHQHIGLRLQEAARKSRQVYLRRILEVYE